MTAGRVTLARTPRARRTTTARGALPTALLALLVVGAGCADRVHVRTDPVGERVVVDGVALGPVGEAGVDVEIGRGFAPVPYAIVDERGAVLSEGEIVRSELGTFGLVALITACSLSTLCAPSLAVLGFAVANPSILVAPAYCVTASSFLGVGTVLASPSCATLPAMACGAALGSTPLALLLIAESPPREVVLTGPRAPPVVEDAPPVVGDAPPVVEGAPSVDADAAPLVDDAPPVDDDAAPLIDDTGQGAENSSSSPRDAGAAPQRF